MVHYEIEGKRHTIRVHKKCFEQFKKRWNNKFPHIKIIGYLNEGGQS